MSARMGLYMAVLMEDQIGVDAFSDDLQEPLTDAVTLLLVTAQMASDELTMMEPGGFFAEMTPENLRSIDNLVSSTRRWINKLATDSTGWEADENSKPGRIICGLLQALLAKARDATAFAFYCSKAASEIIEELTERHGPPPTFDELLSTNLPPKDSPSAIFPAVALLYGVGQSLDAPPSLNTLTNRLVSDAAGAKPTSEKSLATLVMLTCCLGFYQEGEVPVQMNRLVFAVRNVTGWFEDEGPVEPFFAAESCRLLTRLLPEISSVYGAHWENTLGYCAKIWEQAGEFPPEVMLSAIHASIKLYAALEAMPEPNDDLEDALKTQADAKASALVDLLKLPRESEAQPQAIVDGLLCRQVEKMPLRLVKDASEFYGLLASESRDIQTAAFSLMNRALPAMQEQLSVDVLLDKESELIRPSSLLRSPSFSG